jgi:hypothetical protein
MILPRQRVGIKLRKEQSNLKGGPLMSEEKDVQGQAEKSKKGGYGLLIGIGAVVAVLLLIVIAIMLFRQGSGEAVQSEPQQSQEEKRSVLVTEENVDEIYDQMVEMTKESVDQGYFETSMSNEWHFTGGGAQSDAYVANVEGNTNDVYFDVVMENDESNVIYKSPVIPRGGVLENFALDTTLERGTYDCVVIYHLVDEDQNTVSTLRIAVMVMVEN